MKSRNYHIYLSLLCLSFACSNPASKNPISEDNNIENTIDSLLHIEQNDKARKAAFNALKSVNKNDYSKRSFLYNRIGKSYQYSFHFDSAVYYSKMAYNLSLQLNDKNLQAEHGAHLLKVYNQSAKYLNERKKMFYILNSFNKHELTLQIHALVLNALADYYDKLNRSEMCLYESISELTLYETLLRNYIPNHEDSINIAYCHIHISDTYLWKSYINSGNPDSYIKQNKLDQGMQHLQIARKWIGNNSYLLALYYYRVVYVLSIKDAKSMKPAIIYLDSIESVAKKTGYNFNDIIIQTNISICDVYYYFLDYDSQRTDSIWKYRNEAAKYDTNLINPAVSGYLQWLTGDLLLKEKKYDSALSVFIGLTDKSKFFALKQELSYIASIIACYEGIGQKDSAISYYKKHMFLSDSLHVVDEEKVIAEVEDKYQSRLKQDKIDAQNTIIQYADRQRLWLLTGISVLLILLILLIIFYRNKRTIARKLDKQNAVLQQLNQQLDEANQTKIKLFGIISHDLRSPISQIYQLLMLHQSQNIIIDPEEKIELEYKTQKATANLLDTMEDLLTWSKTQMESFNVVNSSVNINDVCWQCLNLLQPYINSKQLKTALHIPQSSFIVTDANFLLAILRNILQNAIKASPEKGLISIRYEQSNNHDTYIKIINEGPLFTQNDYAEALEQAQTSRLLAGGLGLLITEELSRKIGVEIFFEVINNTETCCTLRFAA